MRIFQVSAGPGGEARTRRVAAGLAATLLLAGCSPTPPVTSTPATTESAHVIAVVDGDTIVVDTGTGEERVRLIGIDTPEIGRDGAADECYADQARDFLDELLYNHTVELVNDPTQADVDKYGRLLRYVLLDGHSAAQEAIAAGAGREYTYDVPYVDQEAHQAAEKAAASSGVGLWSACG